VLLSTPLHAFSNFTVSVQLANKREFKQKQKFIPAGDCPTFKNRDQLRASFNTVTMFWVPKNIGKFLSS
jgi:hypothetical protein